MSSFWDKTAFMYDIFQFANKAAINAVCKAAAEQISNGAYVLDCAAGTGTTSIAVAKKAGHVVCTDFSKPMLIQAMKKCRKAGIHNISFAKRDICRLTDRDEKYDAVIAGNVIHLLDDPSSAVKELLRVTKKGGKVIIPTYLTLETPISVLFAGIIKKLGFSPHREFNIDSYMEFIAGAAAENRCTEYSTRLINGPVPAGFSVIVKQE